jgi:homogentisate 1,2-dioxygenase
MPFYHKLGKIPQKRHTQFRKHDGGLHAEEVMGTRGFSGIQSILYHLHPPTRALSSETLRTETLDFPDVNLEHRHIRAGNFKTSGDPITSRTWLLANAQVKLGISTPTAPMEFFYRNGNCDELLFVHYGSGVLRSQFGVMEFRKGDYIVIPVGTTYQLEIREESKFLVLESSGPIEVPKRYRNEYGQLLEHSPFCERDIRVPMELDPQDRNGEFEVHVRTGSKLSKVVVAHHPFDVVGWDGYLYPWIFNIEDFEPITGRIHQPPPVHQTFHADGFVVCSFVPRLFDYHPLSIPVPYNHSNVNSDEILYYVEGNFMSRRGVDVGSFTCHPAGLPHGPHPGTVEKSLGAKETAELAVMVDTFAPLNITAAGLELCDPAYMRSWVE